MALRTETKSAVSREFKGAKIPEIMHAATIEEFGGPEVLKFHQVPVPAPGRGEVLIAIDTAGVGVWDAEMRGGWIPGAPRGFPLILGSDGSGKIVAMGTHVRRLQPGDFVYAYSFDNPKGGFYADYVVVLTAIQGVDYALKLKRDESVIVHGAAGGVGMLAVQFAKLRGARVLATAAGTDGIEFVRRLGADAAIDGRGDDIEAAARAFAPDGIDAVLGLTGGEGLEGCLSTIRSGGRLAYPNGVENAPAKRAGIHITSYDAVGNPVEFEHLTEAIEAGKLQVPIAASFPLADAAKAHQRLAQGHVLGKIVLRTT